jgi:hypothetical protein
MTPLEGQTKSPLEELGVESLDEAKTLIEHGRKSHDRTGYLSRKLERLESRLEEREGETPETDQDSDPNIRGLKSEIRALRSTVAEIVENADEEMVSLKPYFSEVLEEHPDLKGWQSNKTKLAAAKLFARELHKQDHPDVNTQSGNRAHREGSGPPVSTGPTRTNEDDLKQRLDAAKTREERQGIIDEWNRQHPTDEE